MEGRATRMIAVLYWVVGMTLGSAAANAQNPLTDLGVATGYGINNSGQVALDQGIYSNGTLTPLPALPGGSTPATALAINSSGQVAGSAISPPISGTDPIAYIHGSLIDIGSPILTGVLASQGGGLATGINSNNMVVGWYTSNARDGNTDVFTYDNGTVTLLPAFPCKTFNPNCTLVAGPRAFGLNDSGEIVGVLTYQTGAICRVRTDAGADAFSYHNGSWNDFGPGTAYAVNASGQVAGTLTNISTDQSGLCNFLGTIAFLNSNGTTTSLGTLPGGKNSIGYAINASGRIVGSSDFTGTTATHAFFYNGVMNDVNALIGASDPLQPFVTLTSAVGINDSLLVLANGVDSRTNLTHAYLIQAPFIQIAPAALSFGTEAVAGTTQSQSVTVTNSGTAAISLGSISTSGNFSVQTNNCGASLAPSAQCTIAVAFTPTVAGALTGGLTIPSGGANYVVGLAGVAPLTATISASSATAAVGMNITITWISSPGATCIAVDDTLNPAFNGNIAPSGSVMLTEAAAGTIHYGTHCTAAGTPEVDPVTSVIWTWPPVTVTLTASPSTIAAGQSTILTWASANATSCDATGGGSADGWPGKKSTSGNQNVTESYALAVASVTLPFIITCTSSASGLAGHATANVVYNQPPAGKSGGGGALDPISLIALLGVLGLQLARRSSALGRKICGGDDDLVDAYVDSRQVEAGSVDVSPGEFHLRGDVGNGDVGRVIAGSERESGNCRPLITRQ